MNTNCLAVRQTLSGRQKIIVVRPSGNKSLRRGNEIPSEQKRRRSNIAGRVSVIRQLIQAVNFFVSVSRPLFCDFMQFSVSFIVNWNRTARLGYNPGYVWPTQSRNGSETIGVIGPIRVLFAIAHSVVKERCYTSAHIATSLSRRTRVTESGARKLWSATDSIIHYFL